MAAYVLFDMTMAIVSLSLLMSVNFTEYNTTEDCNAVLSISIPSCSPDWGCRSCKVSAVTYSAALTYLLTTDASSNCVHWHIAACAECLRLLSDCVRQPAFTE